MLDEDGQYYANILPDNLGCEVEGVLYHCTHVALDRLDAFESGYSRLPVLVVDSEGQTVEAIAYVASNSLIGSIVYPPGRPTEAYVKRIVDGAREHGLGESIVEAILAAARLD